MGHRASLRLVKFNSPEPWASGDAVILEHAPDIQFATIIVAVDDTVIRLGELVRAEEYWYWGQYKNRAGICLGEGSHSPRDLYAESQGPGFR